MTTKEFLNQAYRIDQRINSKLEQIISLHALATKATSTLSDMPINKTESQSRMAGTAPEKTDKGLKKSHPFCDKIKNRGEKENEKMENT